MAVVMSVATIKESDYTILAPLCINSVVGDDYAAFLEKMEEYCQELHMKGIVTVKVNIDPAAFKVWFGRTNATRSDLSRYAAGLS
jgi:hypothetical protein